MYIMQKLNNFTNHENTIPILSRYTMEKIYIYTVTIQTTDEGQNIATSK